MSRIALCKALGRCFLLTLIAVGGYILAGTGSWIQVGEIVPGQCQRVAGVPAAEDIVIDARGLAYLSSFNADTAGIYSLDLTRLFVVNRATSEVEWLETLF